MASADAWADFEALRHTIKQNTVDRLKHIISGLNEECYANFSKTGKKQELIDRINHQLDLWRAAQATDTWSKAKAVIHQVRTSGMYNRGRCASMDGAHHASSSYSSYGIVPAKMNGHTHFTVSASHAPARHDPYAAVKKAANGYSPNGVHKPSILFKPSPFLRVEQAVSNIVECPESVGAMDRRQQSLTFTLTTDQQAKLSSTSPTYQLRLFCTSSTYHSPGSFRAGIDMCPVEFPPTCEVRVNTAPLTANLKGLKKKPGTAPPADLGKAVRMNSANRVEMVYVNSIQNSPGKKYYMSVMLVEVTPVDHLVERLKKGKFKDKETIILEMKAKANDEDDDIVAGPQKMSLKDPLTFVRVATPSRSVECVHPQCFDAATWYSVNEQTTTWLCPVCDKVLNTADLIVDGYFEDILKQTPDDVEDVMVEADGEWHTSDNKYASARWRAEHPPPVTVKMRSLTPKPIVTDTKGKGRDTEIVILDSDEEDEGRVKRELSPSSWRDQVLSAEASFAGTLPPSSTASLSRNGTVIDLTSDSDDDNPPPPPPPPIRAVSMLPPLSAGLPPRPEKRKASDDYLPSPTDILWKRTRTEPERPNPSTLPTYDRNLPNISLPYPMPHTRVTSASRSPTDSEDPRYSSYPSGGPFPPPYSTAARPGSSYPGSGYGSYPANRSNPAAHSASTSRWQ